MIVINGIAAPTRTRRAADIWRWVVLPTTLVFCLIFAAPVADLCRLSFHAMTGPAQVGAAFTLSNYRAFVTGVVTKDACNRVRQVIVRPRRMINRIRVAPAGRAAPPAFAWKPILVSNGLFP
jgi:hypothetical protein